MAGVWEGAVIGNKPSILRKSQKDKISEIIELEERSRKSDVYVSDEDIERYREELGNPTNEEGNPLDTVAVGKTNILGLEGYIFKGASPNVRRSAGLDDLDDVYPNRSIRSPYDNPAFVKHAEEGVIAEFEKAIEEAGLDPLAVEGDLYIMQSFGDGVCNKCAVGLIKDSPSGKIGIFKQLANMFPKLNVHVSTYSRAISGGSHGLLSFEIINGEAINVVKK